MIVSEAYTILAPSGPTPPLRRAAEQRSSSEWHSGFSSAEGKRQHGRSWRQSRVSVVEAGNHFCQVEESSGGYRLDGCDMEETAAPSAYGASLAGRGFDFQKFVRQPQTIVRLLSWVSVWKGFLVQRFRSGRDNSQFDLSAGASGPGRINEIFLFVMAKTTGYCMCCVSAGRHVARSRCMTAQVNTAVVRGQKRQKTVRVTHRAIPDPTTRSVTLLHRL